MENHERRLSHERNSEQTPAVAAVVPEPIEEPKRCYTPMVDIAETDDGFVFEADLPGTSGDVDVTCEDGVLTISAKVRPRQPEGQAFVRQEYGVGDSAAFSASAPKSTPRTSGRS